MTEYEKGTDGSYFHNNLVIGRDDDPNRMALFNSSGESITAFLNGYAVIPMQLYCELTKTDYDDKEIKEADEQLHQQ